MGIYENAMILTNVGYVPAKQLCQKSLSIWNGLEFKRTNATLSDTVKVIYEVCLSDGSTVRGDESMSLFVPNFSKSNMMLAVKLKDLKKGIRTARWKAPKIDGIDPVKNAWIQGVFASIGRDSNGFKTIKLIEPISKWFDGEPGDVVDVTDKIEHHKSFVPVNASLLSKKDWLNGFLSASGIKILPDYKNVIKYNDYPLLQEIQDMLLTCSIRCDLLEHPTPKMIFYPEDARSLRNYLDHNRSPSKDSKRSKFRLLSSPLLDKVRKASPVVYIRSVREIRTKYKTVHLSGGNDGFVSDGVLCA